MKQKILTLFLALVASVGILYAQSGTCGTGLTWKLSNKTLIISGNGVMDNYTSTKYAPWHTYHLHFNAINIGEGVESIGDYAFNRCEKITSVTIGNSVTNIGISAFRECIKLTSVYISDITAWCKISFGNPEANPLFYAHNLYLNETLVTDLVIPNGITNIGEYTFYSCNSLTSVKPSSNITSVGKSAFYDCSSLTSVENLYNVAGIGESAFSGCSSLTSVGNLYNVTSIGASAFSGCSSLTSVGNLYNVTNIGESAFFGCSSLTSIIIPNSLTSIGSSTFYGCSSLTSVENLYSVVSIGASAFFGCSSLISIGSLGNVTSIGESAFSGCGSLTSIDIPNSVTSIGSYAFSGCESLTSIKIPENITNLGECTFEGCNSLISVVWNAKKYKDFNSNNTPFYYEYSTQGSSIIKFDLRQQILSFTFGDNVECIPACLCSGLSKLTSVDIPVSVTSIGNAAFSNCSSLISVGNLNNVTNIGSSAFLGCGSLTSIGNLSNVTIIGSSAFHSCSSLASIDIPNSVTSIGSYAFSGCESLTSIKIPENLTSLGVCAFEDCNSLTSVVWNAKKYKDFNITNTPFYYYESLSSNNVITFDLRQQILSFTFGDNVECIPAYLCSRMSKLTSVEIPNSVTTIGQSAFRGCTYLEDIVIGSGINVDNGIGQNAFNGCRYLLSVTCKAVYPPVINENVFQDCGVLGGIDLFVPEESVKRYKKATVWSEFNIIGANIVQCSETKTPDGTTICSSELPFVWEGLTFTEAGCKTKTLQSVGGCDSVVTFTLSVYPEITNYETKVLWDDELPYTWEGITFTEAGTETKTLTASTGCDSTVTFTLRVRERHITLQENEDAGYYDLFSQDYNGQTVTTATLNRQFGLGKWATLCLPFNVNKAMMMSLGLNGRVYEFRHADLWDDVAQIYFAPAQSIEAGKGYIVNANAKLALKTSFVFPNVTINTDSDTGDITTLTGYNDGTRRGNLFLVGTLRTGLLQGSIDGNTYLGLKNNMLYYPNTTSGTAIRAYRGFFRSTEPMKAQKVRIFVDGEESGELLVIENGEVFFDADGDVRAPSVCKYIENGVLYIKRNGLTYTAQGQRID